MVTPEELQLQQQFEQSAANTLEIGRSQVDNTQNQTDAFRRNAAQIEASHGQFSNLSDVIKKASTNFESLVSFIPGFGDLGSFIAKNQTMMRDLGLEATHVLLTFTGLLPQNEELFGRLGRTGQEAGLSIATSFSRIAPIISRMGLGALADRFGRVINVADQLQNLQLGLYQSAAASGQLNMFLGQVGDNLQGLEDATARYNLQLYQSSIANHTLMSTVAAYAENLRIIPGALEKNIDVNARLGGHMSLLSASIKVANAWMMKHEDVTNLMNEAYRNFGTSADDALKIVARVGSVTQDLGIPMDIVRQATMNAAESFKMFGDNTQAALNIVESFTPALKESGLGPAAIRDVIQGMTDGLAKMDVARKAFVSGAAGGPGGLAGAFKIDELMATNQMDKVLNMTMSAMQRQFGGPVLERKDVLANPALAAEFYKQIEFIKSVGGLARTDIEAQQVLTAMKHGAAGKLEDIQAGRTAAPDRALTRSLDRGNSIQMKIEENTGELVSIARATELQQTAAAMSSQQVVRALAGRGERSVRSAAETEARVAAAATTAGPTALGGFGKQATTQRAETVRDMSVEHLSNAAEHLQTMSDKISQMPLIKALGPALKKTLATAEGGDLAEMGRAAGLDIGKLNSGQIREGLANKFRSLIPDIGGLALPPIAEGRTLAVPAPDMTMVPHALTPGQTTQTQMAAAPPTEQVVRLEIDIKDGIETIAHKTAKVAIEKHQARGYGGLPTE